MGILVNNLSNCRNHQRPATLDTNAPVTNKIVATITTPRPGILRSCIQPGAMLAGVTAATPDSSPPNTESSAPISCNNTQIVIAKGSHTIRPVIKYFLKGTTNPDAVKKAQVFEAAGAEGATGATTALAGAADSAAGAVLAPASELVEGAGAPVPPPLKSVAYQPEPFN